MAYTAPRTWVAGDVLTAAQLNQHLRDQLLAAFPLGIDAWTSFTPTLTQSGAVTKTVNYAKYQRIGRTIIAQYDLTMTGAGTTANAVLVGLPVAAAYSATNIYIGSGAIIDASTTTLYTGEWALASANTVQMNIDQASFSPWGLAPNLALASGDVIRLHVIYEAAT